MSFPGLGLRFKIQPVAFSLGGVAVHWYGVILCAGFLLALWYVLKNCKRFNLDSNTMLDAVIVGLVCGIVGARLYYVAFFPGDVYWKNPAQIFRIDEGGIATYGGLIGGLLGGLVVARRKKINLGAALDLAALGFLIGQGIGRWGNFVNQEAFGSQTDSLFRMVSENTAGLPVHPCFLYESAWCILGFVLLHAFSLKCRRYNGQIFLLYLVWYGVERFFVEALRADSLIVPVVNLKVSQLVALATVLIGLVFLFKFKKKKDLEV